MQALLNILLISMIALSGCGKKTNSKRDSRRDQIRTNAQSKRQELQPVQGTYRGYLKDESGQMQDVILRLEIKDVPVTEQGQVDSVLVPRLSGFLRFNFANDQRHHVGFGVTSADFDRKTAKLSLKVENEEYKELLIELDTSNPDELSGNWTAPQLSLAGTALFQNQNISSPLTGQDHNLEGDYLGASYWSEQGFYQLIDLIVKVSPNPPEKLDLSATVRMYRGARSQNEFVSYDFVDGKFNPISGEISFGNASSELSFVGRFINGRISGKWSSLDLGRVGDFLANRAVAESEAFTPENSWKILPPLTGTYRGELRNTHPETLLPPLLEINLEARSTSQSRAGQLISGGLRMCRDSFSSIECGQPVFSKVEYNHYTNIFSAETVGRYRFTIKGILNDGKLVGQIIEKSRGKIGEFEVAQL
jgi:hypothetical protein